VIEVSEGKLRNALVPGVVLVDGRGCGRPSGNACPLISAVQMMTLPAKNEQYGSKEYWFVHSFL
jgi:hypothetical protein